MHIFGAGNFNMYKLVEWVSSEDSTLRYRVRALENAEGKVFIFFRQAKLPKCPYPLLCINRTPLLFFAGPLQRCRRKEAARAQSEDLHAIDAVCSVSCRLPCGHRYVVSVGKFIR